MTSWHVDDVALQRWVDRTDSLPQSASVEQHLLGCAACRDRVSVGMAAQSASQPVDLDVVWTRVRDLVELPRPSMGERVLRRLGLPAAEARLVAAAPAFRGAWLGGALLVLLFLAAANAWGHASGLWLFLVIAPLLPCAAVAVSYDPRIEPALEQEVATPYSVVRLVVLRTLAVLGIVLPVAVALGALLPGPAPYLWLLPAIGFVAGVLALSTWLPPITAAAAIGAVWVIAVGAATAFGSSVDVVHSPFPPVYVALVAVSCVIVVARGRHLRTRHPTGGRR
jgi:hypothetical protein